MSFSNFFRILNLYIYLRNVHISKVSCNILQYICNIYIYVYNSFLDFALYKLILFDFTFLVCVSLLDYELYR
jgi:hypothetical protein